MSDIAGVAAIEVLTLWLALRLCEPDSNWLDVDVTLRVWVVLGLRESDIL